MNETQCTQLMESVEWTEPRNIISLAILGFINILVIVGNCLVIAAVFCSHKLRSVTNFFIGNERHRRLVKAICLFLCFVLVSLAVADLLVGLAVLPFSATWEVYKVKCNYIMILISNFLAKLKLNGEFLHPGEQC